MLYPGSESESEPTVSLPLLRTGSASGGSSNCLWGTVLASGYALKTVFTGDKRTSSLVLSLSEYLFSSATMCMLPDAFRCQIQNQLNKEVDEGIT